MLVKRDDLTGLALGGNKARKLEFLCGEAIAQGCDTLVTGGGAQSNHARITAAAASRLGLDCHLALAGRAPRRHDGNLLLDDLFGATVHFTGARDYYEIETSIDAITERSTAEGRRPFAIPVGGASVTGVVAYALAIDELRTQIDDRPQTGSSSPTGPVARTRASSPDSARAARRASSASTSARAPTSTDRPAPRRRGRTRRAGDEATVVALIVDHDHFGEGYGALSDECADAIRTVARAEGILLDPVYSGKAMAALFDWLRDGRIAEGDTVLFWHTGGSPALFVDQYEDALTRSPDARRARGCGPVSRSFGGAVCGPGSGLANLVRHGCADGEDEQEQEELLHGGALSIASE